MTTKKVFTIEIDGIEKACEGIGKLRDCIAQLREDVTDLKSSSSLSGVFGSMDSLSSSLKNLTGVVDKLVEACGKLDGICAGVEKVQSGVNAQAAKKEEKKEEKPKETEMDKTFREIADKSLKNIEDSKSSEEKLQKEIRETIKKGLAKTDTQKAITGNFGLDELDVNAKDSKYKTDKVTHSDGSMNVKETETQIKRTEELLEEYDKSMETSKGIAASYFEFYEKEHEGNAEKMEILNKEKIRYEEEYESKVQAGLKKQEELQKLHNQVTIELALGTSERKKAIQIEYNTFTAANLEDINGKESKYKTDKIKNADGTTNIKETRAQLERTKKMLEEYDKKVAASKALAEEFIAKQEKLFGAGDKDVMEAKAKMQNEFTTKEEEGAKKRKEVQKQENEMKVSGALQTSEKLKDLQTKYQKFGTESLDAMAGLFTANKEKYLAEANKIKEEITKIDAKLTESNATKKKLEEEEKTATGGRLIVIQEQKAREMAANDELTKQKKPLAKEEERLRKEAEKNEKRAQRMNIIKQGFVAAANTAVGISAELAKGIAGIPTAAIIAFQGAVQALTIKKQLEKINMESGGLLRGKRHSQGGMRIEGTNIEVEGDEFVVNRVSTNKNLGLISYINKNRRELTSEDIKAYYSRSGKEGVTVNHQLIRSMYEDGGVLTNLESIDNASAQAMNNKMLDALERINFSPVVSVVDIVDAQNSVVRLRDSAGV